MSGPGLAILLPRELEFVDYPQLAKFAKVKFKKAFRQEKAMKFHTGTPPCCIYLHLEAPQTELYNIDELARIERYFEFTPKQCMQIYAVSSCDGCHRALGDFAIKIAKHFNGAIDFLGALIPQNRANEHIVHLLGGMRLDWSAVSKDFDEQLRQPMPGRIFELTYQIDDDTEWVSHICDTDFFEAWLQHSDFHLLK